MAKEQKQQFHIPNEFSLLFHRIEAITKSRLETEEILHIFSWWLETEFADELAAEIAKNKK